MKKTCSVVCCESHEQSFFFVLEFDTLITECCDEMEKYVQKYDDSKSDDSESDDIEENKTHFENLRNCLKFLEKNGIEEMEKCEQSLNEAFEQGELEQV